MTVGIYGIFNAKTDECLYIGMSKNIEERWHSHLKELKSKRHKRQDFVEWYHSNGAVKELLSFKILEECEPNEKLLNNAEIKWFNTLKPKYFGKSPSLNEKWSHSVATREKIRVAALNQQINENSRILRDLICQNCKEIFHSKVKSPQFCSRDCRTNFDNKRFDKQELTDKYNSGMSLHALAEEYNCSYRTIHGYMVRHNIPRRTASENFALIDHTKRKEMLSNLQKSPRNIQKVLCSICNKHFSSLSIKRHETACTNKPKCMDCQVPVVKKSAKRCGTCYKAFQQAQKARNINKCIDCSKTISKASARRCVACYKKSLMKA